MNPSKERDLQLVAAAQSGNHTLETLIQTFHLSEREILLILESNRMPLFDREKLQRASSRRQSKRESTNILEHQIEWEYLSRDVIQVLLAYAEQGIFFGGEPCYGYERMLIDKQGKPLGILQRGMEKSRRSDLAIVYVKRTDGLPEFLYEQVWKAPAANGWGAAQTAYHLNELVERGKGWKPQKAGRTMTRRDGSVLKYSGFWAPTTIKDMWQRTTYIGWRTINIVTDNDLQGEKQVIKNAHKPIVEDENLFWELFDRDSKKIWNVPKSQYRKDGVKYPLTRKGQCKECGEYWMGALTTSGRRKFRYYRDRGGFKKSCPVTDWSIPSQKLEDAILNIIFRQIQEGAYDERVQAYINVHAATKERKHYENEIEGGIGGLEVTQQSIHNLLELAKASPHSKHLASALEALEGEERKLKQEIAYLNTKIEQCKPTDYSELEKYCGVLLASYQKIKKDEEKQREMLQAFVKSFRVDKVNKDVEVLLYGVPMLPIVRNEILFAQERSPDAKGLEKRVEIPTYAVTLAYRKKQFVIPEEYTLIPEHPKTRPKSSVYLERNREILFDAATGGYRLADLGELYGLSAGRINQILDTFQTSILLMREVRKKRPMSILMPEYRERNQALVADAQSQKYTFRVLQEKYDLVEYQVKLILKEEGMTISEIKRLRKR